MMLRETVSSRTHSRGSSNDASECRTPRCTQRCSVSLRPELHATTGWGACWVLRSALLVARQEAQKNNTNSSAVWM